MMYTIKPTSKFKRDMKTLAKRGCNLDLITDVIKKLATGQQLEPQYNDHPLKGNWAGHRECHIQPDWLLIYRIDNDVLVLSLVRSGTHSDLLDM